MDCALKHRSSKENCNHVESRASARSKPLTLTMFGNILDLNLEETGTEHVCQLLRAFLAFATYAEKDPRVREFLYTLSRSGPSFVAPIKDGQFLWSFLDSVRQSASAKVGHHGPICSRGVYVLSHNSDCIKDHSCKGFEMFSFMVYRDVHWLFSVEDTRYVDGSPRGC